MQDFSESPPQIASELRHSGQVWQQRAVESPEDEDDADHERLEALRDIGYIR